MSRIKKNDQVIIIAGKDKGKTGKVLKVLLKANRAVIENINIAKKAVRPNQQNQSGGFVDIEMPIHLSNISLIDKKSSKATRIGIKVDKNGKKQRISKKSGEVV